METVLYTELWQGCGRVVRFLLQLRGKAVRPEENPQQGPRVHLVDKARQGKQVISKCFKKKSHLRPMTRDQKPCNVMWKVEPI